MEDSRKLNRHEKDWGKIKKFYDSLATVYSRTLRSTISFNSAGFRHLIWKGKEPRSQAEQNRRFKLLHSAVDVLNDADSRIVTREEVKLRKVKKYGKKIERISKAKYWAVVSQKTGKKVTVVVRQIDRGKKHFFSIF